MTAAGAGAAQLAGVLLLAPLLAGLIATAGARLQGRRGPSPLQPYRELRRLWGKTGVLPETQMLPYLLAPPVAAASLLVAALLIPLGGVGGSWGLGNDALVLVGLLAIGRIALALAAWDTTSGFALMGAARDLTFAVFVECLLVSTVLLASLAAGSTDLVAIAAAATDRSVWESPEQWLGAAAFGLVIVAEAGRRPFDNPETHLELTMIHEGTLLEHAGRDLALLEWSAMARQWLVLVLGVALFSPAGGTWGAQLAFLAIAVAGLSIVLALVEATQAKMRVLRVPRWIGAGAVACLLGLAVHLAGSLP